MDGRATRLRDHRVLGGFALTGREFFPHLISVPFHDGLGIVFWLAIAMALVGAAASLLAPWGTTGRTRRRPGHPGGRPFPPDTRPINGYSTRAVSAPGPGTSRQNPAPL